jgi:hypothetical protein
MQPCSDDEWEELVAIYQDLIGLANSEDGNCGYRRHEARLPEDERFIGEIIEELGKQVAKEEWAKVPRDLTTNLDDYLYGGKAMSEDGPDWQAMYHAAEDRWAKRLCSAWEEVYRQRATVTVLQRRLAKLGTKLGRMRRARRVKEEPVDVMSAIGCYQPNTDDTPEETHRRMRGVESSE